MHDQRASIDQLLETEIRPHRLVGRPTAEIIRRIVDVLENAGYRLPYEPSLESMKRLLAEVFRIAQPDLPPIR